VPRQRSVARSSKVRSPRRRTYHHGDLASALVDVTLRLVEVGGTESFSLRDAAGRCGVAVSAAYKHYASKGVLLEAVADRGFLALSDQMSATVERATGGLAGLAKAEACLVALGRAYIEFANVNRNLFRLMFGPALKGGRGDPRPNAPSHRPSVLLLTALEDVADLRGVSGENLESSKLFAWSAVHGFSTLLVDAIWEAPAEPALDRMIADLGAAVLRSLK